MKVHIGVDAESGLIHSVQTTAANVHDLTAAAELLHGEETVVYADAGYQGIGKRPEMAGKAIEFRVAMRPGKRRVLPDTYDKRQREVTSSAAPERPMAHPRQAQPAPQHQARASTPAEPPAQAAVPAAQQDPGLLPLDAATIRTLHGAIRELPRPLLEALTQGFRKRFSIPGEATTIADRILQKRHYDWIEAFLVQHQAGHQPG